MLHGLDYNVSIDTGCDVGIGIGFGTEAPGEKKLSPKHENNLDSKYHRNVSD